MKNKSNKIPDDLFGSEPHLRILQSLVDCKFLRDWDACDLIYQGTRSRPPSALSTAMIEMSRLRKFLIRHGITLPKARRNRGYWLPRVDKEKLRAVLAARGYSPAERKSSRRAGAGSGSAHLGEGPR
jgi:hypothetical protein